MNRSLKAVCLFSGGLDGELAVRLIHQQGIGITAVYFDHIFISYHAAGNGISRGRRLAEELQAGWKCLDISKEIREIIKNPVFGYGKGMNPCIDCRIVMVKAAKRYMEETRACFIVTGEVLGQRPMSQNRQALGLIEKKSGTEGLIVRPLSAKLLPVTIPEQKGWVARDKLLDISGRSRKIQIALAERFNLKDYPNADSGCLLTDPGFSRRLKESLQFDEGKLNDLKLLKIGRHFRLFDRVKLIVGRNERENEEIFRLADSGDSLIEPVNVPGPAVLLKGYAGNREDKYWQQAVYLSARYSDNSEHTILRYGRKRKDNIDWCGEIKVKMSEKLAGDDNSCRRI